MKIFVVFFLWHIHHVSGNPAPTWPAYQYKQEADWFPLDCQEIWEHGQHDDGVYVIYPQGAMRPLPVYCDMTTDQKVWTVFQNRQDSSVDFGQPWKVYVDGFGNANGEYWLGLHNIYLLTMHREYELRVELENSMGNKTLAQYTNFSLSRNALNPENDGYRLYVGSFIGGEAGDSLTPHVGHMFSTVDKDQDGDHQNCADYWGGGFWYCSPGCGKAGINGRYTATKQPQMAFSWLTWEDYPETLRASQMKMWRVLK
ncbi:microfibril-associated glycoprotein 4-like [Pyxicephalus adspersus]|uniref:microfibril-associated glycoprotein 4-like n=1 Tax=Pyxicephalus adspersus TaxID=30357 RepID=UPI003B5C3F0C